MSVLEAVLTDVIDGLPLHIIIDELKNKPGALLPILHSVQNQYGYIPDSAIPYIAESLNQTKAEIHGVISFYHHFRTTKPGEHTVEVCRAEACQAMGGRKLEVHAKHKLGINSHQTSSDQLFSLEDVYCLGNCANAPSIRINDDIHGRVTLDTFDYLIDEYADKKKGA